MGRLRLTRLGRLYSLFRNVNLPRILFIILIIVVFGGAMVYLAEHRSGTACSTASSMRCGPES